MKTYSHKFNTPVGEMIAVVDGEGALKSLEFCVEGTKVAGDCTASAERCRQVETQLEQYFAKERTQFDIALAPEGTEFQIQVWNELSKIPYGSTITYGEQAQRIGRPNASRAVGAANGKNPIAIVVPCHRVIGANGKLTGYAGGMDKKAMLLDLERANRE